MALSEHKVMEALWPVTDPELHVSIVELDMVRGIETRRGQVFDAGTLQPLIGVARRDEANAVVAR